MLAFDNRLSAFLMCSVASVIGQYSYQAFGDRNWATAAERSWFTVVALLVAAVVYP